MEPSTQDLVSLGLTLPAQSAFLKATMKGFDLLEKAMEKKPKCPECRDTGIKKYVDGWDTCYRCHGEGQ